MKEGLISGLVVSRFAQVQAIRSHGDYFQNFVLISSLIDLDFLIAFDSTKERYREILNKKARGLQIVVAIYNPKKTRNNPVNENKLET